MDYSVVTQQSHQGISIHTGFPNPAIDASLQNLDLNTLLVRHSASTFMMRISGDDWQGLGIWHGDIALVDRALRPQPNDIVVWAHEDMFVISYLSTVSKEATIWGVVTAIIHQYRQRDRNK